MKHAKRIAIVPDGHKQIHLLLLIFVICLYLFSLIQLKLNYESGLNGFSKAFNFMFRMLNLNITEWQDILKAALESISVAVLATIISALFAFFTSFLAASNVSVNWLIWFLKGFTATIRAVPTLIWALIFVAFLGLGPFAGVLGLCFHSYAYLVKAFSQAIEEVHESAIEAMKATGSSWLQIMARGVVPTIKTSIIAWTALRFEINIAQSSILGFVGAGGIGHELSYVLRLFEFEKVGFILLVIFLMSFSVEMIFNKLKINVDKIN